MQCDIRSLRNTVGHALPDRQTNRQTKRVTFYLLVMLEAKVAQQCRRCSSAMATFHVFAGA